MCGGQNGPQPKVGTAIPAGTSSEDQQKYARENGSNPSALANLNNAQKPGAEGAKGTQAKNEVLMYRGVSKFDEKGNVTQAYLDATQGKASPRGGPEGHTNPSAHNNGATETSAFTSWTDDPAKAREHATRRGEGIVLEKTFTTSELTLSPNYWKDQDGKESLVKGDVSGAKVKNVEKRR